MDIDTSNVLQDEEYYYFFRALNMADNADIDNGTVTDDTGRILRIRTDRERYQINPNNKVPSKYSKDDDISLEQVYDHIKINYRKDTNCVSLSSNANVSIDYGRGNYKDKYVIVKIPKEEIGEKVVLAGQYMLDEIEKDIEKLVTELPSNSRVLSVLDTIEQEKTTDGYKKIVDELFKTATSEGRYTGKIAGKDSLKSRFSKKQYFTEEQQREYNRVIAKLTALELHNQGNGLLKSITNASLISTIGGAFSSVEWIHYKDIDGQDIVPVSKELMDILALTQQAKQSETIDKEKIAKLEKNIVELINDETSINLSIASSSDASQDLSVEKVHEITNGRIGYVKAKSIIEFALKMDDARTKAKEYSQVMNELLNTDGEYDDIIEYIERRGIVVNPDIISRINGEGVQISESVNLGFDSSLATVVSNDEEKRIITEIFENGEGISDLSKIEEFLEKTVSLDEEKTKNRYYAESILDSTDISKIYKKAIIDKSLTADEREGIINRLEEADCERMYNAFKNAGVNESDISGYILNILADKGYKNYSFAELSRLEDLDEIISKNVENTNLRGHVFPSVMDKLRGINDDENKIEGTQIKLKDYQQTAVSAVDRLYSDGKRFAGVVLPTGAGKSFVAMTEMLKNKNANIVYIAPQHEILCQVQRHILKNIAGVEILTSNEVEELKKSQNTEDVSRLVLPGGKILPSQASEYVKKEFPHLKMMCYQGLSEKNDADLEKTEQNDKNVEERQLRELLKNADANLIIFDELHRSGARTWKSVVQKLIDTNSNANILGITATPIRDVDHTDMMLELARMTGTYKEELENKDYLGYEMYLPEAIQRGLVVEPELVSFNFMLKYTDEYNDITERIENEVDETKKQKLVGIKQRMDQLISQDIDSKDFVKNNITDNEIADIGKVIENTIKKKDGRYIVFLPHHPHGDGLTENEYFDQQREKIVKLVEGIDPDAEISRLSSQDSKSDNHKAITDFENSNSEHLKIMMVIDKLNEGVHVDGINGEIMYRKINDGSTILYMQQLGRVIYALDADNPVPEEEIPIVYDIYNNYLVQHLDRTVNETTPKSDLQKLQEIVEWIDKHGYEPDINSEDIKEARKAITLKRIQTNYRKYIDGIDNPRLSQSSIHEIEQVMQLAYSIDLFNKDIGERIIPPGEKDLSDVQLFKVTATQKKFLELYKEANGRQLKESKVAEKSQNVARLNMAMNALEILNSHDIYIDNKLIQYGDTLEDVLKKCPTELIPTLKEEFFSYNDDYPLGNEYNYAKASYRNSDTWKYYKDSDVRKLYFCGIFENVDEKYLYDNYNNDKRALDDFRKKVLDLEFVMVGPRALHGLNVKTGTIYSEKGQTYEELKWMWLINNESERTALDLTRRAMLDRTMNIIEVLSSHGISVNNELIKYGDRLIDVIAKCPKELTDTLKTELAKYKDDYNIGRDFNFAKEKFRDDNVWEYFKKFDIKKLYSCGLFEQLDAKYMKLRLSQYSSYNQYQKRKSLENIFKKQKLLKNDFVVYGPRSLRGLNVKTGTFFNERGDTFEEEKQFNELVDAIEKFYAATNNAMSFANETMSGISTRSIRQLLSTYREELGNVELGDFIADVFVGPQILIAREFINRRIDTLDREELIKMKRYGILPLKLDEKGIDTETGLSRKEFGKTYAEFLEDRRFHALESVLERCMAATGGKFGFANSSLDELIDSPQREYIEKASSINNLLDRIPNRYSIKKEIIFAREYLAKYHPNIYKDRVRVARLKELGILPLKLDERGFDVETGLPKLHFKPNIKEYFEKEMAKAEAKKQETRDHINAQFEKKERRAKKKREADKPVSKVNVKKENFKDENGFDTKYNFDKDGFYYSKSLDGELVNTGLKYNSYGFRANKKHVITESKVDLRQFNIDGICLDTKSIYDKNGFKQDGTYKETGEMYKDGYNAFDLDEDGKDRKGRMPLSVAFASEFIQGVYTGKAKAVMAKYQAQDPKERKRLLYTATQMCPKIKTTIAENTAKYIRMIKKRTVQLKELEEQQSKNTEEMERLKMENKVLRARIDALNPLNDIEK